VQLCSFCLRIIAINWKFNEATLIYYNSNTKGGMYSTWIIFHFSTFPRSMHDMISYVAGFTLHVFLLAGRRVLMVTTHDTNWVYIHDSVTISTRLFMYSWILFSTLIKFPYYGDADRMEFSRTCKTLLLGCIGLQDTTTVKIIEMAQYDF